MKTLRNSIIAILAIFAVSCNIDDVENRPVVQGIDAPVLSAPEEGNTYVLSPETMDILAERFVWSAANFGEGIIPSYNIEIDKAGEEFDTPVVVASANGATQLAASQNVLNTALLSLGVSPFVTANFEVRVKAFVGENVLYSNSVEMIITPYTTETPRLWVTGSYQSASGYGTNWSGETAPQLKAQSYGNTNFEGYVYVSAAQTASGEGIKFQSNATGDGVTYGMGAGANLIADGGPAIAVNQAGYYQVKVNTAATTLSYSLTQTTWGLIGSATAAITGGDGWSNDIDMTYDQSTKKWTLTTALSAGEIKFRANDAWALNYGDDQSDSSLNEGGANIVVTAGTYKITLDLSTPRAYTYTVELQ
jgi:hypothetical protein